MSEIVYRIAEDDDKENIISLLNEVFENLQKSEGKRELITWNWKYHENIFGKTHTIIAEYNGEVIGTGTLWPFKFLVNGESHLAYQTCGLGVHENFRGRGVFREINSLRIRTAKENNASFLFSFPNENSLPGYKKMGWNYLGKLQWYVKPLNIRHIVFDKLLKSNKSELYKLQEEDQVNSLEFTFNPDKVKRKTVSLEKSREYFVWRYFNRPHNNYGFLKMCERDGCTYGAVYTIMKKGNYKEMVIIDIIARDLMMSVTIIQKTVEIARKYNAMFVAAVQPPDFGFREAIKLGFLPVKKKNLTTLALNEEVKNTIGNINNWSLFAGLHDSI